MQIYFWADSKSMVSSKHWLIDMIKGFSIATIRHTVLYCLQSSTRAFHCYSSLFVHPISPHATVFSSKNQIRRKNHHRCNKCVSYRGTALPFFITFLKNISLNISGHLSSFLWILWMQCIFNRHRVWCNVIQVHLDCTTFIL